MRAFRLNRFRVTSRLYAGFGCLIVLGLVIAACGLWQLARVEGETNTLARVDYRMTNGLNTMLGLETMRRTVVEYKVLKDKASKEQFDAAHGKVLALTEEARRDTPSEERREILYLGAAFARPGQGRVRPPDSGLRYRRSGAAHVQ